MGLDTFSYNKSIADNWFRTRGPGHLSQDPRPAIGAERTRAVALLTCEEIKTLRVTHLISKTWRDPPSKSLIPKDRGRGISPDSDDNHENRRSSSARRFRRPSPPPRRTRRRSCAGEKA